MSVPSSTKRMKCSCGGTGFTHDAAWGQCAARSGEYQHELRLDRHRHSPERARFGQSSRAANYPKEPEHSADVDRKARSAGECDRQQGHHPSAVFLTRRRGRADEIENWASTKSGESKTSCPGLCRAKGESRSVCAVAFKNER
jgi:hypothetical protein